MCSFIFSNFHIENLDYINFFNQKRGPDRTTIFNKEKFQFIHNLLSITGEFIEQPFVEDDIVCLYNGEIYNYKSFGIQTKSDGQVLISLYKKYGKDFVKYLDGEYSIVLCDFRTREVILATDTFSTKPMWIGIKKNNEFCVSSYESCLTRLGFHNKKKISPNTIIVANLDSFEIIEASKSRHFDIENQIKTSYDDVINAFKNSIKKRTEGIREKIFIGLSSGYDSGAIACELNNQNVNFKSYSIKADEDIEIILKRQEILKSSGKEVENIMLSKNDFIFSYKDIKERCEEFVYKIIRDAQEKKKELMTNDKGAVGLGFICNKAKKEGKKIYFSGQGADEILSDYGFAGKKIYNHSTFGGMFPADLKEVFPWNNFYGGTQLSYLAKEENISGGYGIEGRYPFLDFDFVQEFLWLAPELKNRNYKSVLYEYLKQNKFPFKEGEKKGFSCDKGLT